MGMSQREGEAYQRLLNAVTKAMTCTDPKHLADPSIYDDIALEYLDFDHDVDDAVKALIAVVISEHPVSRGSSPASETSPVPDEPYLF